MSEHRTLRAANTRHPAFFPGMAALLLTIVFLGFAPTYYLNLMMRRHCPFISTFTAPL
jgi:hypothetical protein